MEKTKARERSNREGKNTREQRSTCGRKKKREIRWDGGVRKEVEAG